MLRENSAPENLRFVSSTVTDTAKFGVKMLEKTELGGTIVEKGKFVGKTAISGIETVGKTQLGATVLNRGKLVGGTLTNTLTDGANRLGSTVLMGTDLLGQGIQMLIGEELHGSAFFHEDPAEQKGFDDDFDEMLPNRFHDLDRERETKDSMKIEWDEESWGKMDGDPEKYLPNIVVDRTASQKKLELDQISKKGEGNEDEESSVESDKTEDIYFTEAELKAKKKAEKRERKRLRKESRKERKRMSKLKKEDVPQATEKKDNDAESSDEDFSALDKSFLILGSNPISANENENENGKEIQIKDPAITPPVNTVESATKREEIPGPPRESLVSHSSDHIQRKMRARQLWRKLRKHIVDRNIAKAFQDKVKRRNDFFDVFDDDDNNGGIGENENPEAAAKKIRREWDNEKVKVQKLRKQLDDYAANLEKERNAVCEERTRSLDEKKELETQFKNETERNAELTRQFQVLNSELEEELEKKNEDKIQRYLEELRAYNEVLRYQVEQQDTTLRQLHREKVIRQKKSKRKELYGADNKSRHSSSATAQTVQSSDTTIVLDDETTFATYVARSCRTSNMQIMQNNLTEMDDELHARRFIIEMQVMELENLQNELRESEDAKGIVPLKEEFVALQKKKEKVEEKSVQEKADLAKILEEKKAIAKTHAEEISKLKLEQTKKEMKTAQEEQPPAEQGGLFGMLWGDTPTDEISDADILLSKLGL